MAIEVRHTSYGASALSALAEVVGQAKQQDPMAPVTLLVPNNIAGLVARRHLAEHGVNGRSGIVGLHVSTIHRLAEQLASVHLHPRRPESSSVLASVWRTVLNRDQGVFSTVKDHPATIEALVRAHRDLRDLSASGLRDVARVSHLTSELVRLHVEVQETLAPDWYDQTDVLHEAERRAAGRVQEIGHLVIYLPQQLSRSEVAFGRAVVGCHPTTVIAAMTGVRRADDPVLRGLSGLGVGPAAPNKHPIVATRIMHASDSDDEVRSVVREVVAELARTKPHRIAVLYGSRAPYARLLHEQLADAGITTNGEGVRPVHERAIARGFLGVLGLADRDVPRAELFQALADAPTLTSAHARVPVSRWERLSRLAGVVGGDDWDDRLTYLIESSRATIDDERRAEEPDPARIARYEADADAAANLSEFVAWLRHALTEGGSCRTWTQLSEWSRALFVALYGDPFVPSRIPIAERTASMSVDRALTGLSTLAEVESSASLTRLREVLELTLKAELPRVGTFGVGVYVGPLSAAVGLDVDRVHVVGMSEDLYPGQVTQDALMSERVRTATEELPAERETIDAKQRHLLAALSAAPEVVISFARGDLRRSTQRLPSRFILPSLRELTGEKDLAASDWDRPRCTGIRGTASYAAGVAEVNVPATAQEWRVRATLDDPNTPDSVVQMARDVLTSRRSGGFTRFDGDLTGSPGLPDWSRSDQSVSPTALEAYAVCPHRYFVDKMLRVQPLEQPEMVIAISPLHVGNLVHEAMDELIAGCDPLPDFGEPWTTTQRERLQAIGAAKAAEYERRGLTGHPVLWRRERLALLALLDSMLTDDDRVRASRAARVVASELAFGVNGRDPVSVPLAGGGRVLMKGSADKVDETPDGTLIVTDLKTGSSRSFVKLEEDQVAGGTKLQLPVYGYAARQAFGGASVEMTYWFVRRNHERIGFSLTSEVATLYSQTVNTLVSGISAGYFPAKAPEAVDWSFTQCSYCNPDGVAHNEVRARWERKRADPRLADLVGLVDPTVADGDER